RAARHEGRYEVLPRRRLVAAHPALGDGAARSGVRRDESAGRARPAPRRGREDGQGGVTMATMTMDASAIESVERIRAGDPEDMLWRFEEARQRGAKVLVLTTGGKLAERGRASSYPVVTFSYKARPRATLGYSLGLVLGTLAKLNFVRDLSGDIEAATRDLA